MVKFPLKYEVQAESGEKVNEVWKCSSHNLAALSCAVAPEFNGPGNHYTPEDFFGMTVLNCLIAVFKVVCDNKKEPFKTVRGKAILHMSLNQSNNTLFFSELDLTLEVQGASNPEAIKKLLEYSISVCPACNSIKTSKTFHLQVS
ncbi:MAG: OsmC family protein [Parachlamydiales bacterium]|jgi:organic hydroperoxide reductase OsmC/OhrA